VREFYIELDRKRRLVYDFNAWDLITERYSLEGDEEGGLDLTKMRLTFKEIPFLTYAGLCWEDDSLTEERVKSLLNEKIRSGKYTVMQIMNIVLNALFVQAGFKGIDLEKTLEEAGLEKKILATPRIPSKKK